MNDQDNWAVVKYMAVGGALTTISYIAYRNLREFNIFSYIKSNDEETDDSRAHEMSELDDLLHRCEQQADVQREDIAIIRSAMRALHQEIIQFNHSVASYTSSMGLFQPSIAQISSEQEHIVDKSERVEMLRTLIESLDMYPDFPDEKNRTLETINDFYYKTEEHHSRALEIVLRYLPDVHAQLKTAYEEHPECFQTNNYSSMA